MKRKYQKPAYKITEVSLEDIILVSTSKDNYEFGKGVFDEVWD